MKTSISKTQRWLDLIVYLIDRHVPVSAAELMERLPAYAAMRDDSARRVFEQDKRELREAGIPIETTKYTLNQGHEQIEGYTLAASDFFLPYLKLVSGLDLPVEHGAKTKPGRLELAPEDARDVLAALTHAAELPGSPYQEAARRAYAKLTLGLNAEVRDGAGVVRYVASARAEAQRADVATLAAALLERRRVRFRYRAMRGTEATDRRVAPYGLLFGGGSWYLIGYDEGRAALREFHLGRMEALEVSDDESQPAYIIPEDFDLRAYAQRQAWELGDQADTVEAHVRFDFPRSLWAERNNHGTLISQDADGGAVRAFQLRQPEPFLRWLLAHEGAHLLSPPELVRRFDNLLRETASLYAHAEET